MPERLTPISRQDTYCDCGRIASFDLVAAVGPKGRPWRWCICTSCAALETGLSIYDLLAILTRPAIAERVQL